MRRGRETIYCKQFIFKKILCNNSGGRLAVWHKKGRDGDWQRGSGERERDRGSGKERDREERGRLTEMRDMGSDKERKKGVRVGEETNRLT